MNKEKEMPSKVLITNKERILSKNEKDVLRYILRPLRFLDFASNNFNIMDYAVFITPTKKGYNVFHLEFTHYGSTNDGYYSLQMLNFIEVNTLNEAIKVFEVIFNEKTSIICEQDEDIEVMNFYRNKEGINIGILLTRFKDSNNWLEFFIEGSELELALHNNFDLCIDHILCYYNC